MKAVLKFNLPEDNDSFINCSHADNLHGAIFAIDQWLRSVEKLPDDKLDCETAEYVRNQVHDILYSNNVDYVIR